MVLTVFLLFFGSGSILNSESAWNSSNLPSFFDAQKSSDAGPRYSTSSLALLPFLFDTKNNVFPSAVTVGAYSSAPVLIAGPRLMILIFLLFNALAALSSSSAAIVAE